MDVPGKEAVLIRCLRWLTRHIHDCPGITLLASLLVAGAAVFYALSFLQFKTNRADLLSPNSEYNRRWMRYVKEFGDQEELVVAAEGDDVAEVTRALDEVAARIETQPQWFTNLLHRIDHWPPPQKALLYAPEPVLRQIDEQLAQYGPLLQGHWSLLNLPDLFQNLRHQFGALREGDTAQPEQIAAWGGAVNQFCRALTTYLNNPADYQSPQAMALLAPWARLEEEFVRGRPAAAPQGHLQLLQVRSAVREHTFTGANGTVDALRDIVRDVAKRHPRVELGLTGLPVLESDEMRSFQRTMLIASLLSTVGVSLLVIVGFRSWHYPLLGTLTLWIGLAWAFGFVTLFVGHLNLLSMAFATMVIGLGSDYSIHYLARYLQQRRSGKRPGDALDGAVVRAGPSIVTSALTTATAFFTAALTDFLGVAELGLVAGGGILLCLAACLVVLPAMILLSERRRTTLPAQPSFGVAVAFKPLLRYPLTVMAVGLIATVILGRFALNIKYDHNLMHLQPDGLPSVRWQWRILEQSDRSVLSAVSLAGSPAEALQRRAQFEALPSVKRVDEIAAMLPADQERKLPILSVLHERLKNLPDSTPVPLLVDPQGLAQQIHLLRQTLAELTHAGSGAADTVQPLLLTLESLARQLRSLPLSEQYSRLAGFQQQLVADLIQRLRALRVLCRPEPVTAGDLPAGLAQRFVSPAGTWLLRIYARENVWDIEPLAQFVHEVRQVDPEATGSPLQTYEASRQMKSSYERAAAYAFVAIVVLLAFDLRSLRLVLLALVPLAVGVTMLLGTLSLAGIDLNPANMIVLPLILGIGVDNGVYVLHDYQQRRGHYRMSQSTAWAVLLTSMTNIIGFGTLAIADHRGIRSLGLVLVLGMGFCLLASLIFLPALLRWISLRRSNSQRFVHDASAIPPPHHARRADPASAPAEASPQASARAASG